MTHLEMRRKLLSLVSAAIAGAAGVAQAVSYEPFYTHAGGLDPLPYIYSTIITNGRITLSWTAFQGPYQVQLSTNVGVSWTNVGVSTNTLLRQGLTVLLPTNTPAGSFRISSPTPIYDGTFDCGYCHAQTAADWSQTPHASTFDALTSTGNQTNSTCLPCHTLGYGVSTGFIDTNTTPYFEDVRCENCHGPAGGHAGTYDTPAVTLNSKMCGGCHTGPAQPQYDEWTTTLHGMTTNMLFASTYLNTNLITSESRMGQCGPCHSAAVRLALLKAYPTNALPLGADVVAVGIGCVACHDPHNAHPENGGFNLRAPLYSTNYTAWDTSLVTNNNPSLIYTNSALTNYMIASSNFWLQYNPNILVCGQCHQARNTDLAKYIDTAPHHSHQYNITAANIGWTTNSIPMPVLGTGSTEHGINTNGANCTVCHMYVVTNVAFSATNSIGTNDMGHTFQVTTNGCYESGYCHDPATDPDMNAEIDNCQADVSNGVWVVKGMLDAWAASTNCPSAITNNLDKRGPRIQITRSSGNTPVSAESRPCHRADRLQIRAQLPLSRP